MAELAYIRVSSVGQSLDVQRDKALAAGVEQKNIFEEKRSGLDTGRPELKACLRALRRGDTLVITRIDRLARSAVDLLSIVRELEKGGVALKVLDQSIDTSTAAGKALLQMLAVFAEFETAIRSERQADGIAKAKADGTRFGRPAKATPDKIGEIRAMRETMTVPQIMKATGLSKASVYRALERAA
ncbi:recombinase family protein [Rhizobium leguminosarum]|uniref:recombinase family protein n=1 Tax=Rhizobium leguminosarum TaxID=384 RepID=UPI00293DE996|nr:recombinase family protein [Rhizobium leguminosarum]MDV4161549.1 recombinase family protein [Rhizobium leguminosarum]MDV4171675.1 recombinase family protein [Rhizobium leguminosarum]